MSTAPDLSLYDVILVNSSAGKDSQAMLDVVCRAARLHQVLGRVVVVHCDLGRVEWQGTPELAEEHAAHYGVRFEKVRRTQDADLLAHVQRHGKWPGMGNTRYCTSDHKRAPVWKLITRLAEEVRQRSGNKDLRPRILNCLGMRAEESPGRAKMVGFEFEAEPSSGRRQVDKWLPVHGWTAAQVWECIRAAGTRPHPAYAAGMPRLSCTFCIYAPRAALMRAGQLRPDLLAEYVRVEKAINHTFKPGLSLESIQAALAAGEQPGALASWEM